MEQPQKVDGDSMIRSGIRNCMLTSGNVSFEKEEMKQQGCLGIYSECGEADAMKNILPRSTY